VGAGGAEIGVLGAVKGLQDALSPGGPMASRIANLWWEHFWVCTAVLSVVVLLAVIGALRPRRGPAGRVGAEAPTTRPERRATGIVAGAVGVTAVILFVFLLGDFAVGRSLHAQDDDPGAMDIKVTAQQWWWDVHYQDGAPNERFRVSNEIHIPVGRTVRLNLESPDVIHSFWAPSLNGKKDMIPGHPISFTIRADQPGVYDGQCAEFCGMQHAKMRFQVVAQSEGDFDAWKKAQLAPAPEPQTDEQKHGREVFLTTTCVMCHTVQGTTAGSNLGPDLTHIASRQWLAAAAIPNTRGHLGGWILDPQHIKPGNKMPTQSLEPKDLRDLLDYLETLK
jgi:cytochrome c oxidase subunit 2